MTQQPCPTVNLNGTDGHELRRQLADAIDHLTKTFDVVAETAPHGRDYQIGPWSYADARRAHEVRLARISTTILELEEIRREVTRQVWQRRRGR